MSVLPRRSAFCATRTWTCPQCGVECRSAQLRLPIPGDVSMEFLACIGATCGLIFGTVNGEWMGYQNEGVFVPATEAELERAAR